VVAKLAADRGGFARWIETRDTGRAAGGEKKGGEDPQKRGLPGAIGAEQSYGFALLDVKRNAAKRGRGGSGKRLQECSPAGSCRREKLLEGIDADRGIGHYRVYSVSEERKQSGPARA